jgi:hypothetical protein
LLDLEREVLGESLDNLILEHTFFFIHFLFDHEGSDTVFIIVSFDILGQVITEKRVFQRARAIIILKTKP